MVEAVIYTVHLRVEGLITWEGEREESRGVEREGKGPVQGQRQGHVSLFIL